MLSIFVYDSWPSSVDNGGLCGPLLPDKCTFVEEKNGTSELTIEHKRDDGGKWAYLTTGRLILAAVPARTLPVTSNISGNVLYRYGMANVSRDQRGLYADTAFGFRLATLDVYEYVYVPGAAVIAGATYARVITAKGAGYVRAAAMSSGYTEVAISNNANAIESVIPSIQYRPQLFRVYAVSQDGVTVRVSARHVFYDQLGNITSYTTSPSTCKDAVSGIVSGMLDSRVNSHASVSWSHARYLTLSTLARDTSKWTRVSPVQAIMDPSSGVLALWGYSIVRDNWFARIVYSAQYNRGYIIEYGNNLLGIDYSVDTTDAITQLLPVGQTSKGKPLTVPTGTYTVDGASVSVTNGLVTAPGGDSYPTPHIGVLDKGSEIKAAGTDSTSLNAAYVKLIQAALDKFANDACDQPTVTLKVDFLMLGDTAEYAQYKALDKLFLYDLVRVRDPRLGIDVTTEVNRIEWDCILGRYNSIELGSIRRDYARSKLASWMVPGLASLQSYVDTISSLI